MRSALSLTEEIALPVEGEFRLFDGRPTLNGCLVGRLGLLERRRREIQLLERFSGIRTRSTSIVRVFSSV